LRVRKKFPNLKISLREGYQAELETMMQREELDLAVTLIEKKAAPGIHTVPLVELPIVLMVAKDSPIHSADQLWKRDRIDEALICLPSQEGLCKRFQDGLSKLGVDWFPSIEVSSVDLIATYVLNGFGIGVSVLAPGTQLPPGIKALPLHGPEFAPILIGALWRGKGSPILQAFLDELQLRAKKFS
jgi:DNA-binding transcriptional LysR family regulator